ncbi:MAG: Asp-tRNA(Asn)/Glu-tRNA(Gln) amidotransferase subunit GatC [Oscillospiraceae bacterium]|nr:Asp-tRNA(Asn)/Glu-tRNA(Gln) amidotransferase subunit GatC [Oscillospiraceae bacterium]
MYDLEKLESFSKIKLSEEEKIKAGQFFDFWILKFRELENTNTEDVEPLFGVSTLENVTREDAAEKEFGADVILENAPDQYDGYFAVPKIIE